MNDFWQTVAEWLTPEKLAAGFSALLLLAVGALVARLVSRALWRLLSAQLDPQPALLVRRASYYALLLLFVVAALHQLGFNLGVLLGAAGVFSVALGFASQTSASNLISGLFLIGERPFKLGDVIEVSGTTGEVLSIDLLSIKLRTFDNRYVRIPNETLIKTQFTNLTRFPIRRLDLTLGVAYKEDVNRVRAMLLDLAHKNPLCLEEPEPLFVFQGFGASSQDLQFSVWTTRENLLKVKSSLQAEIKTAFDAAGIEIPYPHISVYTGAETAPFPVRLSETSAEQRD